MTASTRLLTPFFCQADVITVSLIGELGPVGGETKKNEQMITDI